MGKRKSKQSANHQTQRRKFLVAFAIFFLIGLILAVIAVCMWICRDYWPAFLLTLCAVMFAMLCGAIISREFFWESTSNVIASPESSLQFSACFGVGIIACSLGMFEFHTNRAPVIWNVQPASKSFESMPTKIEISKLEERLR